MTDFTMTTDADGVATITWDVTSKSMNVMSTEAFAALSGLVDEALADASVKGIIITSGKKDFAGGMDLNVIAKMRAGGAQAIFDGVMQMHHVLRKIERAGMDPKTLKGAKPIVAALPGTARPLASASNSRSPATASSPPTTRRPRSACPRSWSASSPARAAPRGCRASWAR